MPNDRFASLWPRPRRAGDVVHLVARQPQRGGRGQRPATPGRSRLAAFEAGEPVRDPALRQGLCRVPAFASRDTLTPWCCADRRDAPRLHLSFVDAARADAAPAGAARPLDRYRSTPEAARVRESSSPDAASIDRMVAEARATALVATLVDTPAADLARPNEAAVRAVGAKPGPGRGHPWRQARPAPVIAAVVRAATASAAAAHRTVLGARQRSPSRHRKACARSGGSTSIRSGMRR